MGLRSRFFRARPFLFSNLFYEQQASVAVVYFLIRQLRIELVFGVKAFV